MGWDVEVGGLGVGVGGWGWGLGGVLGEDLGGGNALRMGWDWREGFLRGFDGKYERACIQELLKVKERVSEALPKEMKRYV